MKLNNDCVRDILMTVEDNCDFEKAFTYDKSEPIPKRLKSYSHDEIIYHIRQCKMSNLITVSKFYNSGATVIINDLTPSGHQYLTNIRSDTVWNKTKKVAGEIGVYSLNSMVEIANQIVISIIKSHFGLT